VKQVQLVQQEKQVPQVPLVRLDKQDPPEPQVQPDPLEPPACSKQETFTEKQHIGIIQIVNGTLMHSFSTTD